MFYDTLIDPIQSRGEFLVPLFLEEEAASHIVGFGDDAYARFRSAKLFAEIAMGRMLMNPAVLPKFEVVFDGIYLLIGFSRPAERFFISVCFDLGTNPSRPNPPGGGLTGAIVLYMMTSDPNLTLRVRAHLQVFGRAFINRNQQVFYGCLVLPTSIQGLISSEFSADTSVVIIHFTGANWSVSSVTELDLNGAALVLDCKAENAAVVVRGRQASRQHVGVLDAIGVAATNSHPTSLMVILEPFSRDCGFHVSPLAHMLISVSARDVEACWNDAAGELLCFLLIYVAGLLRGRCSIAEWHCFIDASAYGSRQALTNITMGPLQIQRLSACAATARLGRPERTLGLTHPAGPRVSNWLHDTSLCASGRRLDYRLIDLVSRLMMLYCTISLDQTRAFEDLLPDSADKAQGGVGTRPSEPALAGVGDSPTKGVERTAYTFLARATHGLRFVLDEFGRLKQMDRPADSIMLERAILETPCLEAAYRSVGRQGAVQPPHRSFRASHKNADLSALAHSSPSRWAGPKYYDQGGNRMKWHNPPVPAVRPPNPI